MNDVKGLRLKKGVEGGWEKPRQGREPPVTRSQVAAVRQHLSDGSRLWDLKLHTSKRTCDDSFFVSLLLPFWYLLPTSTTRAFSGDGLGLWI